MADTTVEKLATEVGKSVERLIEQFSQAGIKKGQTDKGCDSTHNNEHQ